MNLKLAVAEICGPEGCQVKMVSDGRSIAARYSALVLNRVKIRPGQLVAVDLDPAEPEIAWRWHRGRVLAVTASGATLEDGGGHQHDVVQVPGLETDLAPGDEVWFTGFGQSDLEREIHAKVVDGLPAQAERVASQVLPRITKALSDHPAA